MGPQGPDTDELLRRVGDGDASAEGELLDRHRGRLRRMIDVRIDPRLAARVDPSDVVQEVVVEALQKLPHYLRHRPIPFYPWLRQIAFEKLLDTHARHIAVQKRSVTREVSNDLGLSEHSAIKLVDQLVANGTSPSKQMEREESRERVRWALQRLKPGDREIVILRHLEQLSLREIAAVLAITEAAAQSRYRRAIERLHAVLR